MHRISQDFQREFVVEQFRKELHLFLVTKALMTSVDADRAAGEAIAAIQKVIRGTRRV